MSLVVPLQHDRPARWSERTGRAAARASKRGAMFASVLCLGALCLGAVVAPEAGAATRQVGETQVFATVPYPGNPGGLLVSGQTLYVDTSAANFDREFDGKDDIFAYDLRSGQLLAEEPNPIVVTRQSPVATMGLAGIAQDAEGRLYVADMNGRIMRVDPRTGGQSVYATFPTGTYTSFTDMPVFLAFTADGSLYVGEAAGPPVIWRVPPGGGEAQAWFVDPQLSGTYGASVLGVAVDPSRRELYFAAGNQEPGIVIYRLPFAHPDAAHLRVFHRYSDVVITPCQPEPNFNPPNCAISQLLSAGGIAFGKSGKLYVALFAKNQISILAPDGTEEARFPSPEENAQREVPLNGPLGLAFDGRGSLLVANVGEPTSGYLPGGTQPPEGLPSCSSWVVFDSFVNDTASPLVRPVIP
jgi:DNA-binding beta-propeller fold protein YncE